MNWSFETELRSRGYGGGVALLITDTDGKELYALNARQAFPAASTIKVPLLILALQLAQRGELDLAERTILQLSEQVGGAGILHELSDQLALTWRDVLTLMSIVSDNTATNMVIERLGITRINTWLAKLALGETQLVGKLQVPPEQRTEAQRRGQRNQTSARDQVTLWQGLLAGRWLDPAHTALARDILGRQQLLDIIGRGVPRDQDGQLLFAVASKSGQLNGIHHDTGLVFTPRPLIVALFSQGGLDPREHPENRDVTVLAQTLWTVLAYFGQVFGT